jgi:hypothetical protein
MLTELGAVLATVDQAVRVVAGGALLPTNAPLSSQAWP